MVCYAAPLQQLSKGLQIISTGGINGLDPAQGCMGPWGMQCDDKDQLMRKGVSELFTLYSKAAVQKLQKQ